jgi:hypothetical protein
MKKWVLLAVIAALATGCVDSELRTGATDQAVCIRRDGSLGNALGSDGVATPAPLPGPDPVPGPTADPTPGPTADPTPQPAPAPDPGDIRYKDIDDPADTPAAFKATYTNSNNPWVAGCVIKYTNLTCTGDGTPQKLDACDGTKLKEAVTDNSGDCVDQEGAYAEYDCDQECKNGKFTSGTCETKQVAACGETKVGYCKCS